MSLSRPCSPFGEKSHNKGNGDYFPILALPTELISHSISFLSLKDRLRVAGVNKKLDAIELDSKYYVKFLLLENSASADFVRRIVHNASIGYMWINLHDLNESNREIFNLVKEFDIGDLHFGANAHDLLMEMMVDSFFADLTRTCKTMFLRECYNITADALLQLSEDMSNCSVDLWRMRIYRIHKEKIIAFLNHIGVFFREGKFYSNRVIEVYQLTHEDGNVIEYAIFNGSLEIFMDHDIFDTGLGQFKLELHRTRKSLEESKYSEGYARIEIYPE
ncbi:hypothetical protein PENTCL1PPCAC_19401 [Pristionchus entomophagus]|uniref:F-box domain-containing protein n=1 Tax=Pristionchus entomophagus TaxID=358040 RepID=A0AAV5TSE8_9BILA|nr:hypothetical protein PENTCL1PPCAC_19401 [Pristionchus entomophagus]